MKTNLLKSFVAVAEARSFSRAAREMHLSQSAVSKHIARLETECGVRLVARSGPNVECTPAGSTLLPKAREILSLTAELKDSIHGGTPRRDPDC
jgi:DNA-binding transcriptional LysR family regulator